MDYASTRNKNLAVSSAFAIKTGLAPDGGLFIPKEIPHVSQDDIMALTQMTYPERAASILEKFLTDFTKAEVEDCTYSAYTKEKFETDEIAPLYKLTDDIYF